VVELLEERKLAARRGMDGLQDEAYQSAQFHITNTGTAVYSATPLDAVEVVDAEGQHFGSTYDDVTAGPSMTATLTLRPGEKALGWITFEIPQAATITAVQFTPDSGSTDGVGEWRIP
jgi:hypothetical protein